MTASSDEPAFIRAMQSAMWNSCADVASLERLWKAYDDDIARCSAAGQTTLQRMRLAREKELKVKGAA